MHFRDWWKYQKAVHARAWSHTSREAIAPVRNRVFVAVASAVVGLATSLENGGGLQEVAAAFLRNGLGTAVILLVLLHLWSIFLAPARLFSERLAEVATLRGNVLDPPMQAVKAGVVDLAMAVRRVDEEIQRRPGKRFSLDGGDAGTLPKDIDSAFDTVDRALTECEYADIDVARQRDVFEQARRILADTRTTATFTEDFPNEAKGVLSSLRELLVRGQSLEGGAGAR